MKGSLWMLAAAFFFALMASFTKFSSDEFGTFELVFYRASFGAAVIFIWARAAGRSLATSLWKAHVFRSFLGTLALTIWFFAIAHLPLGTAMTLNYTSPLYMAAILAVIAVRRSEKIDLGLTAAIIAGFAGVAMVLKPEVDPETIVPAVVGLSSGFFAALAYWQVKELSAMKEPEWRIVFYFSLFGAAWGAAGELLFGELHVPEASDAAPLLGLGVSATLAQLSMTRAWSRGNMHLSAVLQFSGIIFAALIGLFFFNEAVSIASWIGMLVIAASGAAATILAKNRQKAVK